MPCHGPHDAGTHGSRRHVRSDSAAASTATASMRSGSSRTSRRCSTTTPCWRRPISKRFKSPAMPFYRADRRGDARLRARGDDSQPGRLLLDAGCRQRRRGRQVLRLERGRTRSDPRPTSWPRSPNNSSAHRNGQLRGAQHLVPLAVGCRPMRRNGLDARIDFASSFGSGETQTLRRTRSKRVWPGRDEKILTAWNGLMIDAFARRGIGARRIRVQYRRSREAADVRAEQSCDTGRPTVPHLRRRPTGEAERLSRRLRVPRQGLGDALRSDVRCLRWSAAKRRRSWRRRDRGTFTDPAGGFFYTADDHEPLLARTKDMQDGSIPSGNATAALAVL